jgi:hypothetical protein
MNTEVIAGKLCYVMEHGNVKVAVTRQGGHMAPVTFFRNQHPCGGTVKPVQPYYISPWQGETAKIDTAADSKILPVLQPLRGDLFCMPFGGDGEEFPPHGETASQEWHPAGVEQNGAMAVMTLEMKTRIRPGSVTKEIAVVEGHDALYIRHTVRGNAGSMTYGHHATLGVHNGPLTVRTSPIRFGFTNPHAGNFTHNKDYFSLASTARFDSLAEVPTIWKDPAYTDCTRFPARYGFMDVLQVYQEQIAEPGWVAAVCAEGGYLWYSFKDVSLLPSTVIWMDNCGRHANPWNGRNVCIGLEDVCSFFGEGISASASENFLSAEGVKTFHTLTDDTPLVVSSIQGTAIIPDGFDAVANVQFASDEVLFISESGKEVRSTVRPGFVFGEPL